MIVIVAGTRTIRDAYAVFHAIEKSGWRNDIREVVSGASEEDVHNGVINVDTLGAIWAIANRIPVKFFPVTDKEWAEIGKPAGPIRNKKMAHYADNLILVWNGVSRGSKSMKEIAEIMGLSIKETII